MQSCRRASDRALVARGRGAPARPPRRRRSTTPTPTGPASRATWDAEEELVGAVLARAGPRLAWARPPDVIAAVDRLRARAGPAAAVTCGDVVDEVERARAARASDDVVEPLVALGFGRAQVEGRLRDLREHQHGCPAAAACAGGAAGALLPRQPSFEDLLLDLGESGAVPAPMPRRRGSRASRYAGQEVVSPRRRKGGEGDRACAMCGERQADTECVPCGHGELCGECATALLMRAKDPRCPLCGAAVESTKNVVRVV
eukprot:m51a1_g14770 hypothetical protein (259) ;mRNA; f:382838-383770